MHVYMIFNGRLLDLRRADSCVDCGFASQTSLQNTSIQLINQSINHEKSQATVTYHESLIMSHLSWVTYHESWASFLRNETLGNQMEKEW